MKGFMKGRDSRVLAGRSRLARVALAVAYVGLFTLACDVHGISDPGTLSTLVVSPNPQTLAVNGTQQFTAVGMDFSGSAVAVAPTWTVVAGGGTISASGVFTAGTAPQTYANTVMATSGSLTSTATVIVIAGPLATITVTPPTASLVIGTTQPYTAVGKDASGNVVPISPSWSVVAGGGTINITSGLFTAGTVTGSYPNTVRASVGGVAGLASVTVTNGPLATLTVTPNPAPLAINATQQFTVVGRDASGNVVAITPSWSVVNGGGTITATTGLFTAGTVTGAYASTVRASVGSLFGSATVTVTPGPLATITVTPTPVSVQTGTTQQFTAVGRDAAGNAVSITPVWSVVNGGGTIDTGNGLFTAGPTAGTYDNTIRASSGTTAGFATVTVTTFAPALATITVTPNPVSMLPGGTQQFTATGRDAGGNVFPVTPVWAVINGGGTIDANAGFFTAGALTGTFNNTVQATSGAIAGTATVNVSTSGPPPIVSLGGAAANGIMAGTAFTCVIGGTINANISISPGSTVTGFPPCVITGQQHLNDGIAIQDQIDLTNAYNVLKGLACGTAIAANLGGTTQPAGVYCTATGIGVTGTLTLDGGGNPNATFVFQAGSSLTTAGNIVLINGAQAKNVYWQVGSSATIGTASQWQGNILALTSITLVDNANLLGRALARNGAVSLGTNNVITLP